MKTSGSGELLIRQAEVPDFAGIRELLLESSFLYPTIGSWWDGRVRPSIQQGRRIVLVVDAGTSIEGVFIGKPGYSAKLCSLRLREPVRNQGVGRALVTEGLTRLLDCNPSAVHVTVSEAAEEGCTGFFESIGFRRIAVERNRYRKGVDEFVYACPRDEIVESVRNELSAGVERTLFGAVPVQMPHEQTLLMSLKPEFAELMVQGMKTVEFRRRFSKKYEGATVVFYITRPVAQFMLTATITKVNHREKSHLWSAHRCEGGIAQAVFDEYFRGTSHGYAITLSNLRKVPNQLVLARAKEIYPGLRPPQSFQKLHPESPLLRALELPVHL